jgi:hypothetical protein
MSTDGRLWAALEASLSVEDLQEMIRRKQGQIKPKHMTVRRHEIERIKKRLIRKGKFYKA